MGEPVRPDEAKALENLTSTFGKAILENVVIALTFANEIQPAGPDEDEVECFKQKLEDKKTALRKHFSQFQIEMKKVEALKQRIFPTGSARVLKLPGMQEDWRADFWRGCLDACKEDGKGALLKIAWMNPNFVKLLLASFSTSTGGAVTVAGVGCTAAGVAFTATGILAPVGVPLLVAGAITTILGVGATAGWGDSISKLIKKKRNIKED